MIKISRRPHDRFVGQFTFEPCCKCGLKTRTWHKATNNSLCMDCAVECNVEDLPRDVPVTVNNKNRKAVQSIRKVGDLNLDKRTLMVETEVRAANATDLALFFKELESTVELAYEAAFHCNHLNLAMREIVARVKIAEKELVKLRSDKNE